MLNTQTFCCPDHIDLDPSEPRLVACKQKQSAGACKQRFQKGFIRDIRLDPDNTRHRPDTAGISQNRPDRCLFIRKKIDQLSSDIPCTAYYRDHISGHRIWAGLLN